MRKQRRRKLTILAAALLGVVISLCSSPAIASFGLSIPGRTQAFVGTIQTEQHSPNAFNAFPDRMVYPLSEHISQFLSSDLSLDLSSDLSSDLSLDQLVDLDHLGKQRYRDGDFAGAIARWNTALQGYRSEGDLFAQASVLSNLALSYQQLSQWDEAERAIAQSLALIASQQKTPTARYWPALAQALTSRGSLEIAMGHPEQALESWQQAARAYEYSDNEAGVSRAQINQAQALRELGYYRQALEKLTQVQENMASQPPSALKAIALHRLGEALRLSGQLAASSRVLTQSLAIAEEQSDPEEISALLLSLGRTAQSQQELAIAQNFYQQAAAAIAHQPAAVQSTQRVPIQLSQLALQVQTAQTLEEWQSVTALWLTIQAQFEQLPANRSTIYHQIHWATHLINIGESQLAAAAGAQPNLQTVAQQLSHAVEQARALTDRRAEAYALGTLGRVYEQHQHWAITRSLTQAALTLSNAISATDIAYEWQWQLGRLWQAPNNPQRSVPQSLKAYYQAVDTLSLLRGDLTAAVSSTQFSFVENVEPIYRQLLSLLLQTDPTAFDYQENLASAREIIELLRLAELDNYFQEACIDVEPIDINSADPKAAILYTLVFEDRLSVILHLPNQPLQHYSTAVAAQEVGKVSEQLRKQLVVRSRRDYLSVAEQLYSWLIAPARLAIDRSGAETLVFVLDGPLQNVPMATLYDGDRFLVEDYAIGLTPGIKLLNPQPWSPLNLKALIAGISKDSNGLGALPFVETEVNAVTSHIDDATVLLNDQFTQAALSNKLKSRAYKIVHVATHGQLGSTPEETYLLAWNELINVRDVNQMLQANLGSREGIELLVLSACETASGDRQSGLGLSGVAIRAGARSTLGSLWAINDEATAVFMDYFYHHLTQPQTTRAAALRAAQIQLLANPQYQHPIYWAPYVLLGSWL